jgi:RimJ/RimL family protein N-acetyltransferase
MFRQYWGSVESEVLAMLGLCLMFKEWDLAAIHGIRFPNNYLTAKFMQKFGFRDVGTVQKYMLDKNGKLTAAIASTLLREDFEQYLDHAVSEAYSRKEIILEV